MFFRQEKLLAFFLAFLGLFFFAPRSGEPYRWGLHSSPSTRLLPCEGRPGDFGDVGSSSSFASDSNEYFSLLIAAYYSDVIC